jgi:hypothetical protein
VQRHRRTTWAHTYRSTNGKENSLKCIHTLFFLTNSYPQERASGKRPPEMKVWKRGHRGSDPSNPDKLGNPVIEAQLVSY